MAQQNFQPNRQQQNRPQQTTTPVTTSTSVPKQETIIVASDNEVKSTMQSLEETAEKQVKTTEEIFSNLLIKSIHSVHTGENTAFFVKQVIRAWFESLPSEEKDKRASLIETGKHMLRQAEDVINDLPLLTL